jgi:hypothetical protein
MAKTLKRDLLRGPGTTSPAADLVGHRARRGAQSARGPPAPALLAGHLPEREAAKELRQTLRTLRSWRQKGSGPAYTKIGRRVFYSRSTLLGWIASLERKPVRASAG